MDFQQLVWQKGKQLYRPMPWREQPVFYYVLVSEIMLQQTQVARVLVKFAEFTRTFPTIDSLAAADLSRVLAAWQGLGYNIVVLTAGLNGLNTSVLEAATIDGCNGVQRFFKVVFPMISPTVFFCTVMTIIGAFKVFAQPYFLTLGGPGEATNTIVLALYRNGFSFDKLGYASAMAWVLFVIVMTVTALQFAGQKKWVNYDA